MKIGIIADTHDQIAAVSKALRVFQEQEVEKIFHLGDWCSPFTLALFAEAACPVTGIFGNNDADLFKLLAAKPSNVTLFDRFHVEHLEGTTLAMLHGDPPELARAVAESERYSVLLCGHSHAAATERVGKTRLINPGGLVPPFGGKDWTAPSVAVYQLENDVTHFFELS